MNHIKAIIRLLGDIIIQQTKVLKLWDGGKGINLNQIHKPVVSKNQSVQLRQELCRSKQHTQTMYSNSHFITTDSKGGDFTSNVRVYPGDPIVIHNQSP